MGILRLPLRFLMLGRPRRPVIYICFAMLRMKNNWQRRTDCHGLRASLAMTEVDDRRYRYRKPCHSEGAKRPWESVSPAFEECQCPKGTPFRSPNRAINMNLEHLRRVTHGKRESQGAACDPLGGSRPQAAGDPLRSPGKPPQPRKSHFLLTDLAPRHIIL